MKSIFRKIAILFIASSAFTACNNNQGKGNNTTSAGTEQYEDVNDPSENRTPTPSMTADSTGALSPANENPAKGSDTATTTGNNPKK